MDGNLELLPQSPPQVVDGVTLKFPAKLWRIVNSCRTGAILWDTYGEQIKIERRKFEDEYLRTGVFFKTSNFHSFIRQLNIYGFRKIPTNGPRNQQDIYFVYKHDFFKRGHPDLLSEVVRNTAVRKTQRENEIREVEAKHGKLEELEMENAILTKQMSKTVDESHPLLKYPADPIMRYGVPVEPLQKPAPKITTVYLNPRIGACDMQRMSPTHLHHQVADVLTAIHEDDSPPFKRQKQSQAITICRPFNDNESMNTDAHCQASYSLALQTSMSNQILFVPNPCNNRLPSKSKNCDTTHNSFSQLSQESTTSPKSNSLMFACPMDGDDNDFDSVFGDTLHPAFENEPVVNSENGGKLLNLSDHSDIDVFDTETFDTDNSFSSLGEEAEFLTPAYFDPGTGIITLLLPPMNPEY